MKLLLTIFSTLVRPINYIKHIYCKKTDETKSIYEIEECYKNSNNEQSIVAKIVDSPRSNFKMTAVDLVLKHKGTLAGFNIDDIVNIIGLAVTEKEPFIIHHQPISCKYYSLIALLFCTALIAADIASCKLVSIFNMTMPGGCLIAYPLAYMLGDIITEVYGYKRVRQLIWGTILSNMILILFLEFTIFLPFPTNWHYQMEYSLIFAAVPRIILAELLSHWIGEFLNSYFFAKYKIASNGQNLSNRIIMSGTICISTNTLLFVTIAYVGVMPFEEMIFFTCRVFCYKLLLMIAAIPFTVWITNKLKNLENLDIFDMNTNFTPFSLDIDYPDTANKFSSS